MNRFYRLIKLLFAWARILVISIKQINAILFLFSFKKIASKTDKHVMLSYLLLFNKRLEFDFLNSIQNSHVHEPSKLVENLQHLHISKEKNLSLNHCLKLKSLGFSVFKYMVLTFC